MFFQKEISNANMTRFYVDDYLELVDIDKEVHKI